ncbi:MAG: hypothetical protein JST09_19350 [Bacteroidetes bacterium]|nr:hypothetical protein [Bacteroidota bacterium]
MNKEILNSPLGNGDIETRLWDYIDGVCSAEEKSVIEMLVQENIEWREKYHELLDMHQLMHSSDLETPSMRFTKNVMEEISRHQIAPAAKTYIDKRVIWGITIFFITMIVAFLVYGFGQIDWSSSSGNGTIDKYVNENLDKVNVSRFFTGTYMTVFMMINVILGLMLLDRYLANKRKQFNKEA